MAFTEAQLVSLAALMPRFSEFQVRKAAKALSAEKEAEVLAILEEAEPNKLSTTKIKAEGVEIDPTAARHHLGKRAAAFLGFPVWRGVQ